MEDFDEERIQELVLHGQKNQRTARQITNWCRNARISRSGGIGMVEQMTGVPIGHMGIECDHAPESGMHCWDLEDAAINFYLVNCESCDQRSPGTGDSIEPLIRAYKNSEKERTEFESRQRVHEARRKAEQLETLERLRVPGADLSNQVVDLLVSIVKNNNAMNHDALVELAHLAPETFSTELVDFLIEQVASENDTFEIPALRTILQLPVEEETKRRFAVQQVAKHLADDNTTKYIKEIAHLLSRDDLAAILPTFALLARPISGFPHLEHKPDLEPLLAIVEYHPKDTTLVLTTFLKSRKLRLIDTAFRAISVLTDSYPKVVEPLLRDVLAKLLRRNHLLPEFERNGGDDRLQVLRSAAVRLFRNFPQEADAVVQTLLEGAGETARSEAATIYSGILEGDWNRPAVSPGEAQEIAFPRILWMAVDDPFGSMDNNATRFFSYVRPELLPTALKHVDAILGAAATLSSKLDDQEQHKLLAVQRTELEELERINRRNSIYVFQRNLISWAFQASNQEGIHSIQRALAFYEALPETEVEMRANVVEHLSTLMIDSSSVNYVIPHLYGAMTNPEPLIRGSAARALGEVSHAIRRDLPDLIFEVNLVLLGDPNVYVHKAAARALKIYDFPEKFKMNVTLSLITLIHVYKRTQDDQMFLVDLLRKYVNGCLTDTQLAGPHGAFVVSVIDQLDGLHARNVLDSLGRSLVNAPDIVPVCIKTLGHGVVDYNGRDRVLQILNDVPAKDLASHAIALSESAVTFATTEPFITNSLITLLAKAACWDEATDVCVRILSNITNTRRERLLQHHYESIRQVCEFESAREKEGISIVEARRSWISVQKQKEDEEAERDERQSFRPFFFR